jgi:hypothetical protein
VYSSFSLSDDYARSKAGGARNERARRGERSGAQGDDL